MQSGHELSPAATLYSTETKRAERLAPLSNAIARRDENDLLQLLARTLRSVQYYAVTGRDLRCKRLTETEQRPTACAYT